MLNCMATYRSADKKPHGNILKMPAPTKLVDTDLMTTGGNCCIGKIMNETNGLAKAASVTNELTRMAASGHETITSIARNSAKAAELPSFARMVFPAGLGKIFAPLSGNWHRSSG